MVEIDINLVLNKIKDNEEISFREWQVLSSNDLLSRDENNITFFEYIFKNKIDFSYMITNECLVGLTGNIEALLTGLKYNDVSWIRYFENEDIFFEPIEAENNKNILDLIFERKLNWCYYSRFKNNEKIIDCLYKYQKVSLAALDIDLVKKIFTKIDGKYIYDKYVENDEINRRIIPSVPSDLIINYCMEKNNYDLFKYCKENVLLEKIDNKTILEILLDKGLDPMTSFKDKEALNILVDRKKYNLLCNSSVYTLKQMYNEKETYLELLFDKQKQGQELYLSNSIELFVSYRFKEVSETVDCIMLYLKNDMIGYIIDSFRKNVDILMYKGKGDKSVLECLLEKDRDLVINKLLPRLRNQKKHEFYMFLRKLGIDNATLRLENEERFLCNEYIQDFNDMYDEGCISEYENELEELKKLFYDDGISNSEIVDALIKSYRYTTSQNNEMAIQELRKLIEAKKRNYKEFVYVDTNEGARFSQKKIYIDVNSINTVNHETSHALHYFLTEEKVPDNYDEVVANTKSDPEIFNRIREFTSKYERISQIVRDSLSKAKISDYIDKKYSGEKLESLNNYLETNKEEKKEKLKDTYPEDVLDILLEKTYSKEAFIEQRKKVEEVELLSAILYCEYYNYIAIADIIDAVFDGKQFSGVLFDKEGEVVNSSAGHGVLYYASREEKRFCEMVANYGAIMKSKDSINSINYLRKIVGDELVDMIEKFYFKTMLESNTYVESEENEMEGKSHGK